MVVVAGTVVPAAGSTVPKSRLASVTEQVSTTVAWILRLPPVVAAWAAPAKRIAKAKLVEATMYRTSASRILVSVTD